MTTDVSTVVVIIQSFSYSWLMTEFLTRVTLWVAHVVQELLKYTPSRSPEFFPGFSGSIYCFLFSVLHIIAYPFVFFSFVHCLSFHLRLLNTPLVSSNFSSIWQTITNINQLTNYIYFLATINKFLNQSWSYDSWIFNFLCNQCLSPLKLWVQVPLMGTSTCYNIMLSLSVTCGKSVVFSRYSSFLHQ